MDIEKIIYTYAKKNGIGAAGICSGEDYSCMRSCLEKNNPSLKGFVEQDIEKRIYPSLTLPGIKSIIVFALSYGKRFDFAMDDRLRGNLSHGAIGEDYHITLKRIFEGLAEELHKIHSFRYKIFVDTGPLIDREVAKRAGIGPIGKNGSVISPICGSMLFIGYMMTDLDLPFSAPAEENACASCRICIDSCPSGALSEAGFQAEKCISCLTQLNRPLNTEEMARMGKQIYGCDICQLSCPKNKNMNRTPVTDINAAKPDLENLLYLSNKAFKQTLGQTAAGWRGKKILQRNALIALGNSGEKRAEAILTLFTEDDRSLISDTAKKALQLYRRK